MYGLLRYTTHYVDYVLRLSARRYYYMKKPSQQKIILHYLKYLKDHHVNQGWELEGKIHGIETPFGFIGFRGDRDVRKLIELGLVDPDTTEKGFRKVRINERGEAYITPKKFTQEELLRYATQ